MKMTMIKMAVLRVVLVRGEREKIRSRKEIKKIRRGREKKKKKNTESMMRKSRLSLSEVVVGNKGSPASAKVRDLLVKLQSWLLLKKQKEKTLNPF
jgi:hypothetical protein